MGWILPDAPPLSPDCVLSIEPFFDDEDEDDDDNDDDSDDTKLWKANTFPFVQGVWMETNLRRVL